MNELEDSNLATGESPFLTLVNAHDKIFLDRQWPLEVRRQACELLWEKALETLGGERQNAAGAQ